MEFPACPFCNVTVPSLEIERHANDHLDDEEYARDLEFAQQISLAPPFVDNSVEHINSSWDSPKSSFLRCDAKGTTSGRIDTDENFCYLVESQIKESFCQVEDGLISMLAKCLELDSKNAMSILSGYVDHFQSVESEDVGWGCGWRNIQMLSSHLLKQRQEAREVLYGGSGFVPDIAALQRWLELAWERGFDTLGSNNFDQKIYGRRNWIGTTECAALFRSFALRARIVDFCGKDVSLDKTVGKRKLMQVYGPMDKFLLKGDSKIPGAVSSGDGSCKHSNIPFGNIEGHQRVVLSGKPPLYFQHDGHSRTIIGIQVQHQINGMQHYNLLILDPASKTRALEKSLKENVGWQKLIKRGVHTLKKDQYQLCFIDPGIASGEELEKLKTLHSICVEF
ncbi:Peptidase C78 [Abeliophyllum distichum]|uniref:Peptidase C78 n=1 Tax=Abeliophyllum distichum TaxID=126358 RepID=A0ABD1V5P9_9LAMI